MAAIFSILLLFYVLIMLAMMAGWSFPVKAKSPDNEKLPIEELPFISVIIAVRNESENILALLQDLIEQHYPRDRFEAIIVDDHSSDGTYELAASMAGKFIGHLKLFRLEPGAISGSTKKKAIQLGTENAQGKYILVTDGDCRVQPDWIQSYARLFSTGSIDFAAGMVGFYGEKNFFHYLQSAEFATLAGIGGSSLRLGIPIMCNAANMGFSRQAFMDMSGFKDVDHIVSGDDAFLLEKFSQKDKRRICFHKDRRAAVFTKPQETALDFYHQRKRWASKWKLHKNLPTGFVAAFVFILNASILVSLALTTTGNYPSWLFLLQIGTKFLIDLAFLHMIFKFLGKKLKFATALALEIIYPVYTLFFGAMANVGGFRWKDRVYKRPSVEKVEYR